MASYWSKTRQLFGVLITFCLTFGSYSAPGVAVAQTNAPSSQEKSGTQIFRESSTQVRLVESGAHYLRLHFPQVPLPPNVILRVSDANGQSWQRLDAELLAAWSYSTAYFNGDTVVLVLEGATTDMLSNQQPVSPLEMLLKGVRVETHRDAKPVRGATKESVGIIIGTDDRVHSENPATGRIVDVGCTGWLIAAGLGLSAGHCFSPMPRQQQILEFNVPPSLPDGTIQHPPASDQFPIDMASVQSQSDNLGVAPGNDWAVFRINRNTTTGASVFAARQAFFRLTTAIPAIAPGPGVPWVSVTGYGQDNVPPGSTGTWNADTQTKQEAIGSLLKTDIADQMHATLVYDADTQGGSSGSPAHLPGALIAIGIHDGGGALAVCGPNQQCNVATGFANRDLVGAIQALSSLPNLNPQFVDARSPSWVSPADGTILRPYRSIEEALASARDNLVLNVVAGYYAGKGLIVNVPGRSVTLRAVAGDVTLGPVPRPVPLSL